jgi:hypothetical protein
MTAAFPVLPAHELAAHDPAPRWLIEGLWADEAVGILGGEPKCGKSFLALAMAVAVASGAPCLGRFPVHRAGRVLLFAAEDTPAIVRNRLERITAHFDLDLARLDLWALATPTVRLDLAEHCRRLATTVAELAPTLLILDPFVRLHRVDENVSAAVVPLLAFLRELQRRHHLAIAVVHHARKGAGRLRTGQALRGTSEFHAWSDSGLFLRRSGATTRLTAEHRAHPAPPELHLTLEATPSSLALVVADSRTPPPAPPPPKPHADPDRVLQALRDLGRPTSTRELRAHLRLRTQTLCTLLQQLSGQGRVEKTPFGWTTPSATSDPIPTGPHRRGCTPSLSPPHQLSFPFLDPPQDPTGNGNGKRPTPTPHP